MVLKLEVNKLHFPTVLLLHTINVSDCTALWMQIITSCSLTDISCVSLPFCVKVSESSAAIVYDFCNTGRIWFSLPKYLEKHKEQNLHSFLASFSL